ncbi:DNA polymerase/3'-5' exonuclease PolX [Candidatus Peregrinibacteria bacterium]|nr:DNA polymerase/3'-5' exonuclease PolX [Candidatus Peregrinibacteria bacterium]
MNNQQISQIFEDIGNLLDIEGANRFRVLAYKNAAENIKGLGRELKNLYQENPDKITKITGIGKDLSEKISEILETGKLEYHQNLIDKYGSGLLDILKIRSIGPKKVKLFYQELGIDNLIKLKKAAESNQLSNLSGMGTKSEKEILEAIKEHEKYHLRMRVDQAYLEAKKIIKYLKFNSDIQQLKFAGSLRRGKATIGDIDILISPKKIEQSKSIIKYFQKYSEISNIIADGPTKTSVIMKSGIQADIRIVEKKSFGAALHYFTGSKEHNVAIREIAKQHDLKVNEYGIFNKDNQQLAGKTEKEMYNRLNLAYIHPRLRENRGELEAAKNNKLPKPIKLKDLIGDLHMHSTWSDGKNTIEEIAENYHKHGFQYIAITDHSKSLAIANGLDEQRFREQWKEIDKINKKYKNKIKILKGIECDIMSDGRLDFPDDFLKNFDIVIASVHAGMKRDQDQTDRIINALKNPNIKILGHPTGREINVREPYQLNMDKVFKAAKDSNVAIEINSQPKRLDLADYYIKIGKENGNEFAINSDSHTIDGIENFRYGIWNAQRGWLEKSDVINTKKLQQLKSSFEK